MDIYVVEGPAGSGKSTIIDFQKKSSPALVLGSTGRDFWKGSERNYVGAIGLIEISIRDMQRTAYALTAGNEVVIIDRWILSSLVYDSIRGEAPMPDAEHFKHIMLGWMSVISGFQNVLVARQRIEYRKISIHWMLNIPDAQTIHGRRKAAGKEYPFDIFEEIGMYRLVRYRLHEWLEDYGLMGMIQHEVQDIYNGEWVWNNHSM